MASIEFDFTKASAEDKEPVDTTWFKPTERHEYSFSYDGPDGSYADEVIVEIMDSTPSPSVAIGFAWRLTVNSAESLPHTAYLIPLVHAGYVVFTPGWGGEPKPWVPFKLVEGKHVLTEHIGTKSNADQLISE